MTERETGMVPLLLPPPGNGCAAINAAAKMCRVTIMTPPA
jgi:hypothetical protein